MKSYSYILLCILFFSCFGCNESDQQAKLQVKAELSGIIEKGPYGYGGTIDLYELDELLQPTGLVFPCDIYPGKGEFYSYDMTMGSFYLEAVATGLFLNEVTGLFSDEELTLEVFADIEHLSSLHINLVSHITSERIKRLMQIEGLAFYEASRQAQEELLSFFGLQRLATDKDFRMVSITDRSEEAAALIVLSSVLLEYTDHSVSRLKELLAEFSEELKVNGSFPEEKREELRQISIHLNLDQIERNILRYYNDRGNNYFYGNVAIRDLRYYIDWDGDGIAGNEIPVVTDRYIRLETDTLYFSPEGGTARVKIESSIKYAFPERYEEDADYERFEWGIWDVSYYNQLSDDGYLEIEVREAMAVLMKGVDIVISDIDSDPFSSTIQSVSAKIHIIQEGNFNNEFASDHSCRRYETILNNLYNAYTGNYLTEALYTNVFEPSMEEWLPFAQHTLTAGNPMLYSCYSSNIFCFYPIYAGKNYFAENQPEFELAEAVFNYFLFLNYYPFTVLWGNAPYFEEWGEVKTGKQMWERELFDLLEPDLLKLAKLFPAEKNSNLIFTYKDIPYSLLSRIYLQTGQYEKAKEVLEYIIGTGYYQIEPAIQQALMQDSREMIYSFLKYSLENYYHNIHDTDRLPVITYTEILLSAAETYYMLGDRFKALECLNKVLQGRGKATVSSLDSMEQLAQVWKEELYGTFSYLPFLRRNNLAEKVLGIEPYQTVFPIPQTYVGSSSFLIQNPGY